MNFQIVKHIIFVLCQIIVIYLLPWTERLASVVEGWPVPSPSRQIHVDSWFSANKRMAIKGALHAVVNAAAWIIVHFSGERTHKSYTRDLQILITPPGFPIFRYSGQNSPRRLWPFPPCCHLVCSRESWNEKQWKVHHSWANTQHLMWRVVATWGHLGRLLTRFVFFRFALNCIFSSIVPTTRAKCCSPWNPHCRIHCVASHSSWWFSTEVVIILVVFFV